MEDTEAKRLCLSLIRAESEEGVINLLQQAGVWDQPALWHFYGDNENNYSTIGNQQSRPDAALVEKLVNSVDARLMYECLRRSIDPVGPTAPKSVRDAVAQFFEGSSRPTSDTAGRVSEWPDAKRTEVARGITLAATGFMPQDGRFCLTISDCGEGQTPEQMADTFLSLNRSNKLRIPFVQGKFNMGGTGALQFCGRRGLQLVVSRRSPAIMNHEQVGGPTAGKWGFTIVRREDPSGGMKSSVYTYLGPRKGLVFSFRADSLPIFPDGREPYAREAEWGTSIKLYEYSGAGYSPTHILRRDGILYRIDLLLPEAALPMRFHECRPSYRGHAGSFETTLTGLRIRLDDDKGENLESGFPTASPLSARGELMTASIYAFKKGKADAYRKSEGIIFTVNGQTHGQLSTDFFTRQKAGRLNYIADSILVAVDCSEITGRAREDLFMNSRDRLSGGDLRQDIERALEDLLRTHDALRALKERRRREEIEAKLDNSKPLEDILEAILKASPSLSTLFLHGVRLSNPFKTTTVQQTETYRGKRFPTYFKFKDKEYGKVMRRECRVNQRLRVTFETDALNEYFARRADRGTFSLMLDSELGATPVADYVGPNLNNGIATLTVALPPTVKVGDELRFRALVSDNSRVDPFDNRLAVRVLAPVVERPSGESGDRRKPPDKDEGKDREKPVGISLPKIVLVPEADWAKHTPAFDKYTALRIKVSSENGDDDKGQDVYDFFVNVDNIHLQVELKTGAADAQVVRARFKYGLVLIGLALVHQNATERRSRMVQAGETAQESSDADEDAPKLEDSVESVTKALAPVILPIIQSLGALDADALLPTDGSGEIS